MTSLSVNFQRTTRRYTPEDSILHNHRCENLKSYMKGKYYYNSQQKEWPLMGIVFSQARLWKIKLTCRTDKKTLINANAYKTYV
jgi:hypothetical protein